MNKIVIVCDNFKIGGIQRLALDQAYELGNNYGTSEIIVLSAKPKSSEPSFERNEQDLIKKYGVRIFYFPGSRFMQFKKLKNIVKENSYSQILSHSLRGSILLWFLRAIFRYEFRIITEIHQLPSLSAPVQRAKRFYYSRFSDRLLIFSKLAKEDWEHNLESNLIFRVLSGSRKLEVCRNGVFLPRLKNISNQKYRTKTSKKRIIFIGRLKAWKGLEVFLSLASQDNFRDFNFLVITPNDPNEFRQSLTPALKQRIDFIVGKSVSDIEFTNSDLHIYPVDYGPNSNFTEGISINVLEMSCMGVPSLISKNGSGTWPELKQLELAIEVNWSQPSSIKKIIIKQLANSRKFSSKEARKIIDIRNNLVNSLELRL
jgi:glycosyltransferase involved in cell wall biosynthesis